MTDAIDLQLATAVAVAILPRVDLDPIGVGCRALCRLHGPHPGFGCYCDARGGRDCHAREYWREIVVTLDNAYREAGIIPRKTRPAP